MSHPHDHHHHNHLHGHSHGDHGHLNRNQNIGLAFVLNLGLSLFELVGGVWIGSFAVLAGAIHDFGDAISLGLAWYLERVANQRKNELFNFGYRRFSLLSALLAGVIILSGSIIICFHAIKDFGSSHQLNPKMMILFATIGIFVNAISAWRMSRGKTKNERILTWHLIEDFLSWVGILLSSVIIFVTEISWLDPLFAVLLSIYVAYNVYKHLKSTIYLFLQARPEEFNEKAFSESILKIDGIFKVTNIATWSLDGVHNILSCRIVFSKDFSVSQLEVINRNIRNIANEQGHFEVTLEPHYLPDCDCLTT